MASRPRGRPRANDTNDARARDGFTDQDLVAAIDAAVCHRSPDDPNATAEDREAQVLGTAAVLERTHQLEPDSDSRTRAAIRDLDDAINVRAATPTGRGNRAPTVTWQEKRRKLLRRIDLPASPRTIQRARSKGRAR